MSATAKRLRYTDNTITAALNGGLSYAVLPHRGNLELLGILLLVKDGFKGCPPGSVAGAVSMG